MRFIKNYILELIFLFIIFNMVYAMFFSGRLWTEETICTKKASYFPTVFVYCLLKEPK